MSSNSLSDVTEREITCDELITLSAVTGVSDEEAEACIKIKSADEFSVDLEVDK